MIEYVRLIVFRNGLYLYYSKKDMDNVRVKLNIPLDDFSPKDIHYIKSLLKKGKFPTMLEPYREEIEIIKNKFNYLITEYKKENLVLPSVKEFRILIKNKTDIQSDNFLQLLNNFIEEKRKDFIQSPSSLKDFISFRNSSSHDCYTGNNPIHIPLAFKFIGTLGVNSIYSKACLLNINGYDEQYDYYLDATDLCARLIDAGYYINYQKGADVYHKFSPSHLRDKNHCIKNYTPIIKNFYYYIHQYKPFFSEDYIEKEFFKVYNHFLNDNYCLYKDNKITKEEYIKAKDSIEEGIKEGKKSVARGYKLLMTQEILTKYKSDYKPFPNFFKSDL